METFEVKQNWHSGSEVRHLGLMSRTTPHQGLHPAETQTAVRPTSAASGLFAPFPLAKLTSGRYVSRPDAFCAPEPDVEARGESQSLSPNEPSHQRLAAETRET